MSIKGSCSNASQGRMKNKHNNNIMRLWMGKRVSSAEAVGWGFLGLSVLCIHFARAGGFMLAADRPLYCCWCSRSPLYLDEADFVSAV